MSVAHRWVPAILWGALILVATSLPASTLPSAPAFPGADKVVHAAMYGVLGWLAARAVADRGRGVRGIAILGIAALAVGDEWHQRWIPGRSADVFDWMADVAGATLGASLLRTALLRRETRT